MARGVAGSEHETDCPVTDEIDGLLEWAELLAVGLNIDEVSRAP